MEGVRGSLATLAAVAIASVSACGEDTVAPQGPGDAGAGPQRDAGSDAVDASADGGVQPPHPLEGTSRTATLVRSGFGFSEGPVWIGGRLLFSDIETEVIHELLPDGGTAPFRANSGAANGNAVDPEGRLVTCEGGNQRVTRSKAVSGALVTPLATTYASAAFNAPNDVIVRGDGNVYFTDPKYGGDLTQDDEAVYRIDPGGAVTRIGHDFVKPNGVALSPDGATLYVVDNGAGGLYAGPVDSAGTASTFEKLGDAPGGDGMAVDDAGNLYVTTSDGVRVLDPKGALLGTITVAEQPANCTFGGEDRKTLYITARHGLYAIVLNVPGLP
jgi:gluconolactonase